MRLGRSKKRGVWGRVTAGRKPRRTVAPLQRFMAEPLECRFMLAGMVMGTVYHDINSDGIRNATEAGLSGWVVYADLNDNKLLDKNEQFAITSSSGVYTLSELPAGVVIIREQIREGWKPVLPALGFRSLTVVDQKTSKFNNFGNHREGNPTAFPFVESIALIAPSPTDTSVLGFNVRFNQPVTGVDASDFVPAYSGVTLASPLSVTVTGRSELYTVVIRGINGSGTLGLNLVDNGSIHNKFGLPLTVRNAAATFATQKSFPAGSSPRSLALGDVNADGNLDIAVANYLLDGTVSVLLGDGEGTFQPPRPFATGLYPQAVLLADTNADGEWDLVVAHGLLNGAVSVLQGAGDGSFQQGNNETDLTVEVLKGGSGYAVGTTTVTIAPPRKPGGFAATARPSIGSVNTVSGVIIGIDIVSPGSGYAVGEVANVSIGSTAPNQAGQGATAIATTQQAYATGAYPNAVSLIPGETETSAGLVVSNGMSNTVSVLLSDGANGFSPQKTFATGIHPYSVKSGDINRDSYIDLAVVNYGSNTASVLFGKARDEYEDQQTFATGRGPRSLNLTDMNNDGALDMIIANRLDNTASLIVGNAIVGGSQETFGQQKTFATGVTPETVAVSDVNGDGLPDIVTANTGDSTASVLLGGNAFQLQQTFATGNGPASIVVEDINHDNRPDLIITNQNDHTLSVLLGNGNGNYTGPVATINSSLSSNAPVIQSVVAGDRVVTVTWAAPASGAVITDYIIYFSNNGTTWTRWSRQAATNLSAVVTGLTNGVVYVFKVGARASDGSIYASGVCAPLTPSPAVPSAGRIESVIGGNGQATLKWYPPLNNGGLPISDYIVSFSDTNGFSWTTLEPSGISEIQVLSGGAGYTPSTTTVTVSPPRSNPLGAATARAVIGSDQKLGEVVGIQILTYGKGYLPGEECLVTIRSTAVPQGKNATARVSLRTASTALSTVIRGLTNATPYVFKVAAVNSKGVGEDSTASLPITPTPDAPSAVSIAGVQNGSVGVSVTWTAPLNNGGAKISNYIVSYSGNNGMTWTTFVRPSSTALSALVTGLSKGTPYQFKVAAVNSAGIGLSSLSSSSVVFGQAVPSAVSIRSVVASNTSVTVAWNAPRDNGGTPLTDYAVEYSSDKGIVWNTTDTAAKRNLIRSSSTDLSAVILGLTNGTAYVFRVRAVNSTGTGEASNFPSATPSASVPSPVLIETAVPGNRSATVTWSAPLNAGIGQITGYILSYSTNAGATWAVFNRPQSGALVAVVTKLTNKITYLFKVVAVNGRGAGVAGNFSLPTQPISDLPDAVVITAVVAGNSSAMLAWSLPKSPSPVTNYVIKYSSNNGATWATFIQPTSIDRSAVVTTLLKGRWYIFTVTAVNAFGTGPASGLSARMTPT